MPRSLGLSMGAVWRSGGGETRYLAAGMGDIDETQSVTRACYNRGVELS